MARRRSADLPAWGLGVGITTIHGINKSITTTVEEHQTVAHFLDKRLKLKNVGMIFGIWDVKSWHRAVC
jgi:hypothetical protein